MNWLQGMKERGLRNDFWLVGAGANYSDGGLGRGGLGLGSGVKNSAPPAEDSPVEQGG